MLIVFHVNVITCQNFNLPHIYCNFATKIHFLRWKISNLSHGIQTWFNYVNDMVQYKIQL